MHDNMVHLTPISDTEPHSLILCCECEPSIEVGNFGVLLVVHNPLNPIPQIPCAVETAKAILNNHEKRDN